MNVRRQLYKKYRLEGYSRYAAARKAGYSHNTAKNARVNVENHGDFDQILEQAGLTDDYLARHAEEGAKAERVISVESDERNERGQKIYVNVTVPDWVARHKYYETILKLRKKSDAGEKEGSSKGETKIIIIRADEKPKNRIVDDGATAQAQFVSRSISL